MSVLGLGIDVVDLVRLRKTLESSPKRFLERICTPREAEYCQRSKRRCHERVGARFAAKEAFGKAIGSGMTEEVRWHEIEVVHDARGRPGLELHGRTAETATQRGIARIDLSLSHDGDVAAAVVLLED